MYGNLTQELRRKGISQSAVARMLNCAERTLTNKLNGTTEFTFGEAMSIWKDLLPEFTLDYLFDDTDRPA